MAHHHTPHIPTYEGDGYPRCHWFICETIWEVANMTNETNQIAQFGKSLSKRVLTWYSNFIEIHKISKS